MEISRTLYLNALKTEGAPFKRGVIAYRIETSFFEQGSKRYELARRLANKLRRKYGGIVAVATEGSVDVVYLAGGEEPVSEEVEIEYGRLPVRVKTKYAGAIRIGLNQKGLLKQFLEDAIRCRLRKLGFKAQLYRGKVTGKYYDPTTPRLVRTGEYREPVYIYDGLHVSIRILDDGNALLFLEPSSVWRVSLLDYVKKLRPTIPLERIEELLRGDRIQGKVMVGPRWIPGYLVEFDVEKSPDKEIIEDFEEGRPTLRKYWLQKHKISLPEDDFVARVDIFTGPSSSCIRSYPASQVFVTTKGIRLSYEQKKTFETSPSKKRARTLQLLRKLVRRPFLIGNLEINFDSRGLLSVEEAKVRGWILSYSVFELPNLAFGGNGVGKFPRDLERFGPYSGPRDVNVLYVFPSASKHLIDRIHNMLASAYSSLKLGELRYADHLEMRGRLGLVAHRKYGEAVAEMLEEMPDPKIALVILPYRSDLKFQFVKGGGGGERFLQFMTAKTATLVVNRAKDGFGAAVLRNLAAQIYLKASPAEDRVLWILNEPAGGAEEGTIYAGYDISRQTKREYRDGRFIGQRSEAAIRAALCDPRGRVVKMSTVPAPRGEALNEDVIIDMLFNLEEATRRSLGLEPVRFVLLKDGEVGDDEREIVRAAVSRVREERPELRFELYSVVKRGKERLYLGSQNPMAGTYVIFNKKEGLLVSSDLALHRNRETKEERVHANPLLIRRELVLPSGSAPPIMRFFNEFFDLSRLHWHSITYKMKTALPLKIVQEMGHYARRNILIPEHIPYLPL